MVVPIMQSALS